MYIYIYMYICVCACVCACVRVFGVNCLIKLGQPRRIFFITFFINFFFYTKRLWKTETKSSQVFNYTQVIN